MDTEKFEEKNCNFPLTPYNGLSVCGTREAFMESKPVKIAVIDNSIDHAIYNPILHWSFHLNAGFDTFRAKEMCFPDFRSYTHLILTGSEATIVEMESWAVAELEVIKEAVACGVRILGSCYGHQLLAVALAGPEHVRRCAEPEIGWISIQITEESELLGPPRDAFTFTLHFDEVIALDGRFLTFSRTDRCPVQAFQLKAKPVWGIQAHPEIDIPEGRRLLERLIQQGRMAAPLFEAALRQKPRDSGLVHQIVHRFLHAEMCGENQNFPLTRTKNNI